ncbi:MAG: A24 family peptidase [Pseudomonadota bacterium]
MTSENAEPDDPFPDVRTNAARALIFTTILAALYGLVFVVFGRPHLTTSIELISSLGLGAGLLLLSYIDLRTGLLLDMLTWPLVAFGLGYAAYEGTLAFALAGAVIGYGLIAGLGLVWRRLRGYEGIGLGDAKLLAAGGAWVGVMGVPLILLFASGTGLLVALSVSQRSRLSQNQTAIAFGPSLAFAIWIVWCWGSFPNL